MVFGNCSECHNGDIAIGKSEFHAPTNAECDDCHNTTHFLELGSDGSYDHSNILRECSGCHNGTVSQGKNEGHLVTSTECGSCHTTVSFSPAYPDHTDPAVVNAGCYSCHVANGTGSATGQSAGHPVTNAVVTITNEQGERDTAIPAQVGVNGQGLTPGRGAWRAILLSQCIRQATDTPDQPAVQDYSYRLSAEAPGYEQGSTTGFKPDESWKVVTLVLRPLKENTNEEK